MLRHLELLKGWRVVEEISLDGIRVNTNYFTVPKKDGKLRLVVDGRKVNALMHTVPRMELPGVHEVIDYVMGNNFALTVDGVSYFYQIGISPEVGTMFCANLSGSRGCFTSVRMNRLPMGWNWAPAIAQKISNTLLTGKDGRRLGLAWLDNFIFAAKTQAELEGNFSEFLARCHEANVKLDEETPTPSTQIDALGISFDLQTKTYKLKADWVRKKAQLEVSDYMTPRELYGITGALIWNDYILKIPLCERSMGLEVVKRVARLMGVSPEWDTKTSFDPQEVNCINAWMKEMSENPVKLWRPQPDSERSME
jgi:hypothetical protein